MGKNKLSLCARRRMNTLCPKKLVWMICGLLFAGCDATQPHEPAAPIEPKPFVFNPSIRMVAVDPGRYVRVTDVQQTITLTKRFWIGTHEISQAEYQSVMGSNPSFFKGETLPVEKVKFDQAVEFCRALTLKDRKAGRIRQDMIYRLPTEAEWEFACLGGATTPFSFSDIDKVGDFVWSAENGEDKTQPVGGKKPNAWGLYDMHGNVWEWVVDWFAPHPKESQLTDPEGPPSGEHKVFKGGGWSHEAKFSRATSRFMMAPDMGINFVGFRVVLSEFSNSR